METSDAQDKGLRLGKDEKASNPTSTRKTPSRTLDDLHDIVEGPGCSDLVSISCFIDSFADNLLVSGAAFVYSRDMEVNKILTVRRMMSVDEEMFRSLSATMNHSQLMCGAEEIDATIPVKEDNGWISLRVRKSDLSRNRPWHTTSSCMLRVGSLKVDCRLPVFPEPPAPRIVNVGPRVKGLDAILTVSLFRMPTAGIATYLDLIGQFAVLGSTTLQNLVKRFKCTSDHVRPGDFSDHPEQRDAVEPLKDRIQGYFVFIEGVFYCSNWDYPNTIASWAAENKIGNFEVQNIEGVRFAQLKLRLGRPYLYMHSGDCQHHVIFNDLRLLNEQRDDPDTSNYPMLLGQKLHQQVNTTCQLCCKGPAEWIVTDHPKMKFDPSHICSTCNQAINYDAEGKRKYNFKLFAYTDWSQL